MEKYPGGIRMIMGRNRLKERTRKGRLLFPGIPGSFPVFFATALMFFSFYQPERIDAEPAMLQESMQMCECLKQIQSNNTRLQKRKCLVMQEKHVEKLKEGSKDHRRYKQEVHQCEMSLNQDGAELKNMSFQQKIEHVCGCFRNVRKQGEPPMKCFRLQSQVANQFPHGQKKKFIQETNRCAD